MNKLNVVNEYSGISARAKPPLLSMRGNFLLTPVYAGLPSSRTDSGTGGEETKLGRGRVQDMHLAFVQTKVGQSKGNLLFKSVFYLQKKKQKTKNKPGQNLDR